MTEKIDVYNNALASTFIRSVTLAMKAKRENNEEDYKKYDAVIDAMSKAFPDVAEAVWTHTLGRANNDK